MQFDFDFSAKSDIGLIRKVNEDSCYASSNLLIVADGMGGHPGGDIASSIVVSYLSRLDTDDILVSDAAQEIQNTLTEALNAMVLRSARDKNLAGMGTTLSMLLRAGGKIVLAHIGDSRIYRWGKNGLEQLSVDHTFVQGLIDEGELSPSEARSHPQRNFIMRALGDFNIPSTPDFQVFEAEAGDRFLICSDGLTGVVTNETLEEKLAQKIPPARCANDLIQLALKGSSLDNITVVVADVLDTNDRNQKIRSAKPQVAGAVASDFEIPTKAKLTPAAKAALVIERATNKQTGIQALEREDRSVKKKISRLRIAIIALASAFVILIGGFSLWAANELSSRYFVGVQDGYITIFRGINTSVIGIKLYWPDIIKDLKVADLPQAYQSEVEKGMVAGSLENAEKTISNLENEIAKNTQK
jgi:protein phosphatase